MLNEFEQYDLPMHGVRLPEFALEEVTRKKYSFKSNDNLAFIKILIEEGLNTKIGKDNPLYKIYTDRIKIELDTITELGFVDYFLLVWTVINFCREKQIPVGMGRGSAAGSIILYLIGVTEIDSIKHGLYFERFISKTRAKKKIVDGITYLDGSLMCDVDLDICYYRRPELLQWLEEKFKGKTSKILTFNTLSGKLLIKECMKIIGGFSETETNMVSGYIPRVFGVVKDLKSAYEEVKQFKDWVDQNQEIYKISLKLRDLIKNKGVHASGVLICYEEITRNCPIELTSDKHIVSGYDMNWVSLINIKLDCLGLRCVSVVDDVCKQIGKNRYELNYDSGETYYALQDLKTPHGIFQIEADTSFASLKKIKPKNLDELSGVMAIARPGALAFLDQYAKYTNTGEFTSIHPFFDDILSKTGGLCLYQESLMQMVVAIGFTLEDAETIRRVVGKKKIEEIKVWEDKIKQKVQERKLDPNIAKVLWDIANASASYSFNKCLAPDTLVENRQGEYKHLFEVQKGDYVKSYDIEKNTDHYVEVLEKMENEVELYEITLEDGRTIKASLDHKFLVKGNKMVSLKNIIQQNLEIVTD